MRERRKRPLAAGVGLGVVLATLAVVVGCGPAQSSSAGSDAAKSSGKPGAPTSAAASPSPGSVLPSPWASASGTAAQRAAATAALTAYNGMWEDLIALGATSDYKNPQMAAHMVYQPLTDWMQQFASDSGHGIVTSGRPTWTPEVVSVTPATDPTHVEIADCLDDSHWLRVYAATGRPVDNIPGGRHRTESIVSFVQLTNSWMVTQQMHGKEGSC